jgi:hypothetical protein
MRGDAGTLLVVLFGTPCSIALLTLLTVLFPRVVRGAQRAAAATPGRSFLLGVVNLLFLGVLTMVFAAAGERGGAGRAIFQILAIPPAVALGSGLLLGLAAISALIGERIASHRGAIAQAILGSASMLLASLTPLLGWLLFFPYVALLGLGGLVIGLFSKPPAA